MHVELGPVDAGTNFSWLLAGVSGAWQGSKGVAGTWTVGARHGMDGWTGGGSWRESRSQGGESGTGLVLEPSRSSPCSL